MAEQIYKEEGKENLADQTKRLYNSRNKTASEIEKIMLDIRAKHKNWGGHKLKQIFKH